MAREGFQTEWQEWWKSWINLKWVGLEERQTPKRTNKIEIRKRVVKWMILRRNNRDMFNDILKLVLLKIALSRSKGCLQSTIAVTRQSKPILDDARLACRWWDRSYSVSLVYSLFPSPHLLSTSGYAISTTLGCMIIKRDWLYLRVETIARFMPIELVRASGRCWGFWTYLRAKVRGMDTKPEPYGGFFALQQIKWAKGMELIDDISSNSISDMTYFQGWPIWRGFISTTTTSRYNSAFRVDQFDELYSTATTSRYNSAFRDE